MSVLDTVLFEKFRGTGNDFFVIDTDDPVPNCLAFAHTHCDREAEITLSESERRDADGVLFLAFESCYDPPRVVMTFIQSDGSVATICGNGARIAATWAAEWTGANEVMINTPAGTRHASLDGTDATVEMGAPSFTLRDVPLVSDDELVDTEVEGLTAAAVNTGVPHVVAFVDDVDDVDLELVALLVRHASVFPEGVNATLISSDGEGDFCQRTFERGVGGKTQSCGTGAVVVVAAAKRLGRVSGDGPVTVTPLGGALSVITPDEGAALPSGPAVYEGDGGADIVFRKR